MLFHAIINIERTSVMNSSDARLLHGNEVAVHCMWTK